jgi:hypothetical protein
VTTQSVIRDPLAELLKSAIAELIDSNVDGITEKLTKNETGKLSVSFGAKLSLKGEQVAATVRLSYTEKHDDSVECRTKDPNQLEIGGVQ